jgi:hypothetical protein
MAYVNPVIGTDGHHAAVVESHRRGRLLAVCARLGARTRTVVGSHHDNGPDPFEPDRSAYGHEPTQLVEHRPRAVTDDT